jgi:purine operon repressor
MSKLNRSQRLISMTRMLAERPGELIPLGAFTDRYGAAKSTISEDLSLIKEALELDGSGMLRTQTGAIGGVQYWPVPSPDEERQTLTELCRLLAEPGRVLPGGFLYMTDLVTHPAWINRLGAMLGARFLRMAPEVVLTVETKGIPLALMVARVLGIPMVMARREGRVTEGPSFTVHYVSGESRRIQSMTVGARTIVRAARVLIIDDFMKAGATARSMVDLVGEMGATVVGVGIFVATAEPSRKRVEQYVSLLTLVHVDEEERKVLIHPAADRAEGKGVSLV